MQFVKTPKPSRGLVTTNGHVINKYGRVTHHPKGARTHGPLQFISVDGEGMTVNGEHRYVLFGVGDKQIEDPDGLYWRDIFEFLYAQYQPRTAFTGFFLGYDFTQIIKTLPEDRAYMLLTSEGRALRKHRIPKKPPHPVQHDGWLFDMLAMKRLRIRPKTCDCPYPTCKCEHDPWMYVCDAGGFFQASFLSVIDPKDWMEGTEIVTAEEFATIKEGKERRSTAVLDEDMRRYNVLENQVLARVMRTVDAGFQAIGINLPASKWFGPGQAAQAWLKNENVSTGEQIRSGVPAWFLEAARMTYYGGWFELFMHGHIPGETHEYDINSAYPSVIASLPCLIHGAYSRGNGLPSVDPMDLCLVYARVKSPSIGSYAKRQHIGTMLHRASDGSILRPLETEGWFWWDELQAAQACGLVKPLNNKNGQQVMRWVRYQPCDCPPPMAGIRDLYLKRLAVGKTSSLGRGAKYVYNSAYGKFAQSVGEPVFGNPVYASRITSGCRTLILNAIASHPRGRANVAMIATDAVYFLTPHPSLPLSEKLGEWDHKIKSNLTLFKPGVYWDDKARERIASGQSPHFKARGFKASDFAANLARIDAEYQQWADSMPILDVGLWAAAERRSRLQRGRIANDWPAVTFTPSFAMVTALQALRRNAWDTAGAVAVDPMELRQDSNPFQKRRGLDREEYDGRVIYRSRPIELPEDEIVSTPYQKRFGMEDPWSDEYKEQLGIHPDGNIADILAWIMNGE